MKVSHRHQVHVQLTGREVDLLLGVLGEFAESSRLSNLSDDELSMYHAFVDKLSGEETGEDGSVENEV